MFRPARIILYSRSASQLQKRGGENNTCERDHESKGSALEQLVKRAVRDDKRDDQVVVSLNRFPSTRTELSEGNVVRDQQENEQADRRDQPSVVGRNESCRRSARTELGGWQEIAAQPATHVNFEAEKSVNNSHYPGPDSDVATQMSADWIRFSPNHVQRADRERSREKYECYIGRRRARILDCAFGISSNPDNCSNDRSDSRETQMPQYATDSRRAPLTGLGHVMTICNS